MATASRKPRSSDSIVASFPPPTPPAAADVATELEEFRRYLDKQIANGIGNVSVEAVLAEFRLYQNELRELRESLRDQRERAARGEDTSRPWDLDAFLEELNQRLDAKGIPQ